MFISRLIFILFLVILSVVGSHAQSHKKYFVVAQKAYMVEEFEQSILLCNTIIEKNEKFADAYLLKGKCLLELHRFNEALDQFYTANNLLPQESEFCFYKGYCEWKLKRYSKAIKTLELALELSPDNLLAYMYIGTIYYELKMYEQATLHFNKALDIDAGLSVNMFVKERFMEYYGGAYKISMNVSSNSLKKLDNKVVSKADELFLRALLKSMSGDNWSAFMDINSAIKTNPNASIYYFYRGYMAYGVRKLDESIADLKKYTEANPNDQFAKEMSGSVNAIMNLKYLAIEKD